MRERKKLTPSERLIVAADFKPTEIGRESDRVWAEKQVGRLAKALKGTGVYLKVNSALRAVGYDLIEIIRSYGLKVFADLKLYDIPETLATDGAFLKEVEPELLTVVCSAGVDSMQALNKELPETEILGVTVLTSLKKEEIMISYDFPIEELVMRMAVLARDANIGGIICSPKEAEFLRKILGEKMTINTPAIRPTWAIIPGDDQNPERIMTPAKAIKAGADRIVVGRPIVRSHKPYDAVMQTIDEIASAVGT